MVAGRETAIMVILALMALYLGQGSGIVTAEIYVETQPQERIKITSYSIHLVPVELDTYRDENPTGSLYEKIAFGEKPFLKRKYEKIYSVKAKNKKPGDYRQTHELAAEGPGTYMTYIFFDEVSWARNKRGSRKTRNSHYSLGEMEIGPQDKLVINIRLREVDGDEALYVDLEIVTLPL